MFEDRKIVLTGLFIMFTVSLMSFGHITYQRSSMSVNTNKTSDIEVEKVAYLTFDDGPSANTKKVLDILDKYNVKATFFVIGCQVEDYETVLQEMEAKGHSVGLHTYSHCYNKIYISTETFLEDFYKEYDILCSVLENAPRIYRFPGGSCSCYIGAKKNDIIVKLESEGFKHYDWNVSAEDSVGSPTEYSIMSNIKKDLSTFDKAVILMHDSSINSQTVKTLPGIIEYIKSMGYTFDVIK